MLSLEGDLRMFLETYISYFSMHEERENADMCKEDGVVGVTLVFTNLSAITLTKPPI